MADSPVFKRPSEVMRLHRRKKKEMQLKNIGQGTSRNRDYKKGEKSFENQNPDRKRRNPFCSSVEDPPKIPIMMESDDEKVKLFKILSQLDAKLPLIDKTTSVNSLENNFHDTIIDKKPSSQTVKQSCLMIDYDNLPVDWSVKTKVRFLSETSFTWCSNLKTMEEAAAISSFVRCENISKQNLDEKEIQRASFRQHCMYWMHPNFPWIHLFPRIHSGNRMSQPAFLESSPHIHESLLLNWRKSFRSLFLLLRAKHCPYFYVCADTFTVLFRAAGIAGVPQVQVIVTPTTRGFRKGVQSEGIDYSMPLKKQNSSSTVISSSSSIDSDSTELNEMNPETASLQVEDDDDLIFQEDDAACSWIESIGLDKRNFPSLNPIQVKLQRENIRYIDHRPESTIYIEGAETQAFFNFLLNYKSCISNIGPMAGIPPTLLAPVAFEGASLESLQTKEGLVQHEKKLYSLEVTGPILPQALHKLCDLLQQTGNAEFSMFCTSHESNEVLSDVVIPTVLSPDSKEQLKHSGLPQNLISKFCDSNCIRRLHEK